MLTMEKDPVIKINEGEYDLGVEHSGKFILWKRPRISL